MTLREALSNNGYTYNSVFSNRAEDIYFNSSIELCYALGYILGHLNRIDAEIPEFQRQMNNSYPITDNITSGGHEMKRAPQYRVYLSTTRNIPRELNNRLQNDDQMRFTGSLFIEACFFIGFIAGHNQNQQQIENNVHQLFPTQDEQDAFYNGYNA